MTDERVLNIHVMPASYAVCRLDPAGAPPLWVPHRGFSSVTRTPTELSVVCEADAAPAGVQAERGWRVLAVQGPLDFSLLGIVAALSALLAAAAVSIFVVSTYETDYLLVRDADVARAVAALRAAGHHVSDAVAGQETP